MRSQLSSGLLLAAMASQVAADGLEDFQKLGGMALAAFDSIAASIPAATDASNATSPSAMVPQPTAAPFVRCSPPRPLPFTGSQPKTGYRGHSAKHFLGDGRFASLASREPCECDSPLSRV